MKSTNDGATDGKSTGMKKDGSILSAYPQDNAGNMSLPDTRGGKMGGSTTNLSHSLRGSSAVQK
jgi:hypothetical protein